VKPQLMFASIPSRHELLVIRRSWRPSERVGLSKKMHILYPTR